MKRCVFALAVIFLISCNDGSETSSSTDTTIQRKDSSVIIEDTTVFLKDSIGIFKKDTNYRNWKIPNDLAYRMTQEYQRASCNYYIIDSNHQIRRKLADAFPADRYEIQNIRAKHVDTRRRDYARVRGIFVLAKRTNVNGNCTELIKVIPRTGTAVTGEEYYDIYTICPPPELEKCDNDLDKDTTKPKKDH
jgi:hypothetical protein